jgi:ankyrin repeat protein
VINRQPAGKDAGAPGGNPSHFGLVLAWLEHTLKLMKAKPKPLLKLHAGKSTPWEHQTEVELILKDLEALGYRKLADVTSPLLPFVKMRALVNSEDWSYALVHDEAQSTWVDLFSVGGPAARQAAFAVTSAEAPLIGLVAQRPTYFASVQLPKVSVKLLQTEFLRLRPQQVWAEVSEAGLLPAYEALVAADAAWQRAHLAGRDAERKMGEVVKAAYARARALRPRDPASEFWQLLHRLRLPHSAFPELPQSLTSAAGQGDLQAVKQFLENGANINEKSAGYESPLALAALSGHCDIVNFLLEQGANPQQAQFATFSPIANAARRGHVRIVQRLLQAGVNAEQKAAARAEARQAKHQVILDLLAGRAVPEPALAQVEARPPTKPCGVALKKLMDDSTLLMGREPEEEPLASRDAAEARVLELLRLAEVRATLGQEDEQHGSCLDLAVASGSLRLVRAILEALPPAALLSPALIGAAERGLGEVVELLLQAGADPKFATELGMTALIAVSSRGDLNIVRRLLAAGANPKAKAMGGETAFTEAGGPFGKQIKQLLKESAGPALTRGSSVIMRKGSRKVNLATARGVAQFRKALGQPEWALACIEAAPEAVARAYAQLHPDYSWHADVAHKRLQVEPPFLFILRLRGQAWTILLRTVGWLEMEDIHQLPEDARQLSALLKTRVLTYMAEDTSSCEGYELFKDGDSIEKAEWMGKITFRSSWRQKPKFGKDFPEPTFSELGIYLPECWLDSDGDEAKLVLGGIASADVERLDCFELTAQSE